MYLNAQRQLVWTTLEEVAIGGMPGHPKLFPVRTIRMRAFSVSFADPRSLGTLIGADARESPQKG